MVCFVEAHQCKGLAGQPGASWCDIVKNEDSGSSRRRRGVGLGGGHWHGKGEVAKANSYSKTIQCPTGRLMMPGDGWQYCNAMIPSYPWNLIKYFFVYYFFFILRIPRLPCDARPNDGGCHGVSFSMSCRSMDALFISLFLCVFYDVCQQKLAFVSVARRVAGFRGRIDN